MTRASLLLCLLLGVSLAAQSSQSGATPEPLERHDGFIGYAWNARQGVLEFVLTPTLLQSEFLRFTGLDGGVGSLSGGGDRGTVGPTCLCRFQREGNKVLVIQENTRFRATVGSPELQHSVEMSFPVAVLASLPILSEDQGTLIVNANPLILADTVGMARQLRSPAPGLPPTPASLAAGNAPAGQWRLDESRSAVVLAHTQAFPLNTETEALLTFVSDNARASTAATPDILSVRVHQSFVALPAAGYEPREFDPRVGYFTTRFEDFSQPYDASLNRQWIERWRLQKKDPNAAVSDPVKPITFYLDQAIPEPQRSAIRRGALWWNQAFLQAGFSNALVILDLPEGADPNDFRYPTIQWTNREGRGWSVGQAQDDPRTGEILHAVVQLDSHRMRTVHNFWDALQPVSADAAAGDFDDDAGLDAFAALDQMDSQLSQEQVMENRIALLACHEMGHVLGLEHNFLASNYDRGSVMDYFAPRVTIRPDGSADLSDAYMQGVGSYDKWAIQWGYSTPTPGATSAQEGARLDGVVHQMVAQGIVWGSAQDPRWSAYDDGPDPVTWLKQVMPVRDALLKQYGPRMQRAGEPASMLADRFALVYLFHQYGLSAALNVIGGAKIPPALVGDGQTPVQVWPDAQQREALRLEMAALNPTELDIPTPLWKLLAPLETSDPVLGIERFRSSAGYVFDPFDGAQAVADLVVTGLLDPQRLERLETFRLENPEALSADEVIAALLRQAFPANPPASQRLAELQSVVETEVAEDIMQLASNETDSPTVRAVAWSGVEKLTPALARVRAGDPTADRLRAELALYLRDPHQFTPRHRATPAPVGPPTGGQ